MFDNFIHGWNARDLAEQIKYIVTIPIFVLWSIYDILTKTVITHWQRTLIGFGIIYNFVYLFIDKGRVNDDITGFIICYAITYLYRLAKRLLGFGDLGKGDVVFFGIIGLLFGTAIGLITIILSFLIFDILLNLIRKIFPWVGSFAVAFFPFITCALFLIIFIFGEQNVRNGYVNLLNLVHFPYKFFKIF